MKKVILMAGIALAAASTVQANPSHTVTLTAPYVAMCENKANVAEQNFCHGFGQGVYDTYLMSRHPKSAPHYVCPPDPAPKRSDVLAEFIVWANQNKQFADKSAADTIMRYLAGRYPCPAPKKRG